MVVSVADLEEDVNANVRDNVLSYAVQVINVHVVVQRANLLAIVVGICGVKQVLLTVN